MSKFTPGPWHAYDRGIGWEVHAGVSPGNNDESCPNDWFDCINNGLRETFTEADARLIAAAPEMLELLKSHAHGLRYLVEFRLLSASHQAAAIIEAEHAERLIAKAEGSLRGAPASNRADERPGVESGGSPKANEGDV